MFMLHSCWSNLLNSLKSYYFWICNYWECWIKFWSSGWQKLQWYAFNQFNIWLFRHMFERRTIHLYLNTISQINWLYLGWNSKQAHSAECLDVSIVGNVHTIIAVVAVVGRKSHLEWMVLSFVVLQFDTNSRNSMIWYSSVPLWLPFWRFWQSRDVFLASR